LPFLALVFQMVKPRQFEHNHSECEQIIFMWYLMGGSSWLTSWDCCKTLTSRHNPCTVMHVKCTRADHRCCTTTPHIPHTSVQIAVTVNFSSWSQR